MCSRPLLGWRTLVLGLGPLLLLLAAPASPENLVFAFAELTDRDIERIDLHDGRIDDWLQVIGEPLLLARDAHQLRPAHILHYDPADFDFRVWLAWHAATDRLYVAAEFLDDEYVNDFDRHGTEGCAGRMSCWDSYVALLIDGDLSGGAFVSRDDNRGASDRGRIQHEVGAQQWYGALAETRDTGPHAELGSSIYVEVDWALRPPYSDGGGRRFGMDPAFSVVEFYVTPFDHLDIDSPEASRATDLYPGRTIGFAIRVQDVDNAGSAVYCFEASPADEFDLTTLPHAVMVPQVQAGEGLDQLPEATWATVKHAAPADPLAPQP